MGHVMNFSLRKENKTWSPIDKEKNTSLVEVTIHEGRNHIVRKLFATLGYDVLKLSRIAYGNLTLGNLKSGEYRLLSHDEVKSLYGHK